ncbi:interleukin-6 receptor subunit beta-like [Nematolebias whitei]|uniref:interleukin-6 receptor subunit beta-like n=1 Tax=Nematolebias whitei TaxID=451745 RepID=UPI001898662A|nr:interleukin-6 receptor subunit beta-like [Nematolebias whitei]
MSTTFASVPVSCTENALQPEIFLFSLIFFKSRLSVRSGSAEERMSALEVIFLVTAVLSVCKGQRYNICNVEPKDVHIEVGSSVKIMCQSSCVSGKILWTLNNKPVSELLSTRINSTHTELSLKNVTDSSATLECHSSRTHQVLGGTTIKTFSRPNNVSCVLHYKNQESVGVPELFTCRWDHLTSPSKKINYTVLMGTSSKTPSLTEICISRVTNCTYKDISLSGHLSLFDNHIVIVRARTAAWKADSDPFEFDPEHIIKVNPPMVKVTPSSDHLEVTWRRPCSDAYMCFCQVKYYKASLPNDETPKMVSTTNRSISIKEVASCVIYNISVRCAQELGLWSDWSPDKTIQTKLNKRHVRLHLWRKVAAERQNGKRKVHLMWTGIPSMCEEPFSYTIKQTSYTKHSIMGNYTHTSCGSSTCDIEVDQRAHRFYLTVSSNEGLLAEKSVYVPNVEESLPQINDIQALTHEGITKVSWTAPVQPVSGYVIDWTHNGDQYDWKKSTFANATLFDLLNRTQYNITVTPLLNDRTGRSTQALQICSSLGVPENVAIRDVQTYDTSAFVEWDTKPQHTCSAVVTFTVFYELHEGSLLNITVDGKSHNIILKDLKPETQYSVFVEAKGHDGTTMSKKSFFTTKKNDPRLIKVLSVCGSILCLLVLFLGLCCAIQWRKFKEKPVPNPGLSSVAKWLSQNHQKKLWLFQPFTHHSETICDQVHTEEIQSENTLSITPNRYANKASDHTDDYCNPSATLTSNASDDNAFDSTETQLLSSPGESISSLSTESSSMNPYRSQSSVETSMPRTKKQSQVDSVRPHAKTSPKSVYVSLNMLEQGNVR